MPRISADSVPEHRERMFAALVDSTEELLFGRSPVTAGAVAARVGIARNSIYRYVDSVDDLVEAAIGRSFPRWADAVRAAVLAQEGVADQAAAYARSNLELAADGSHSWHHSLSRATLSPSSRKRLVSMHSALSAILGQVLDGLPVPESEKELLLGVVQAVVDSCIKRVDAGDDTAAVIEFAERKVRALVAM